jgi:hypothetical protein
VKILNEGLLRGEIREPGTVTVSYDEKPGIQALAQKTPDRPPALGSMPARPWTTNTNGCVFCRISSSRLIWRKSKNLRQSWF